MEHLVEFFQSCLPQNLQESPFYPLNPKNSLVSESGLVLRIYCQHLFRIYLKVLEWHSTPL